MPDLIVLKAMEQIARSPSDYATVEKAVANAVAEAAARERQRIRRKIKASNWGNGDFSSFECRLHALGMVDNPAKKAPNDR